MPNTKNLAETLRTFTATEIAPYRKLQGSPRRPGLSSLQAADAVLAARG
mgnify:CR=1 FL=1